MENFSMQTCVLPLQYDLMVEKSSPISTKVAQKVATIAYT